MKKGKQYPSVIPLAAKYRGEMYNYVSRILHCTIHTYLTFFSLKKYFLLRKTQNFFKLKEIDIIEISVLCSVENIIFYRIKLISTQ